ncbi:hypothetical protein TL16_g01727 [Triparma laevis f. inornata]|uniref:Uncharacterized protein n=1 Tax=Triparma laevis f. inornata TaxID=1714386 RepID=A0A9W6ZRL8_9STRA|nr:hypothetical protein TL16_g01727 [Triparma laevis f. inornata]
MSKSVVSETHEGHKSREMSGKRRAGDEGKENEEEITKVPPAESLTISTVVSTAPATTNQFMYTPEFRTHFVKLVPGDTVMRLRLATKGWKAAVDALIDEGVESGAIIVRGEEDFEIPNAARRERRALTTRVIFLLNIIKVGKCACYWARNLVVVGVPEGVESIGFVAFGCCPSLTTVSLPAALRLIGGSAFSFCISLENVDLLRTNLQELSVKAFRGCSELKSVTIPDSLQALGDNVFYECPKLIPSSIDVSNFDAIIGHLFLQQLLAGNNFLNTDDFRRLLVPFLPGATLMTIRLATKPWSRVADAFIDEGVEIGAMIVHGAPS